LNQKKGLVAQMLKKGRVWGIVGIPASMFVLGGIAAIYGIQGYFTRLERKAGKIGLMKAMEELNDPRYFVDKKYSSDEPSLYTTRLITNTNQANMKDLGEIAKDWMTRIQWQRENINKKTKTKEQP
jgi:hypothetical protein